VSTPATRRFVRGFGVTHPVVNAPMARIAGGELAAAVDGAGGLGLIGGGYGDLGWIREQWARAGAAGTGVGTVGVGLILWVLDDPATKVDELLALGVRTFFLSFGDPTPCVARIHDAGGRVVHQVNTLEEARQGQTAGVDAIAVQADGAGGHGRPGATLVELLPAVVDLVAPTPVLAGGGIADARDVARARSLGAAGVVVGTRFYATHEALDTSDAKERLVTAESEDTIRTSVFDAVRGPTWPEGYDGRAIVNEATRLWHGRDGDLAATIDAERARYAAATEAGDLSWRAVWAGIGVDRITRIDHAADVVAELSEPLE
jgi:nitronate monooxygenase